MTKEKEEEKHSQEFIERSALQDKDLEVAKAKHNMAMDELIYRRESDRLFHERQLERGRIQRAEARKDFQDKKSSESYGRR